MVAVDDFKFEVYPFVEDEGTVVDLLFGEPFVYYFHEDDAHLVAIVARRPLTDGTRAPWHQACGHQACRVRRDAAFGSGASGVFDAAAWLFASELVGQGGCRMHLASGRLGA